MDVEGGEFGIIKEILSPLASTMPGAFGLTDDAACLKVEAGQELVITKDAMVAGVHFFEQEKPALIAKKLLRTNLSDLAAMGAKPVGYLLATAWTENCDTAWIKDFAVGLAEDQQQFCVGLLGGDTVRTSGPLTLSLTAIGSLKVGTALRRNSAKIGDLIYVTGTIGDGALGLQSLLGKLNGLSAPDKDYLENRCRIPNPRLEIGQGLVGLASSCLDISDGLLADCGHICEQSGVGATLFRDKIPLSEAASRVLQDSPQFWSSVFGGGEDYELCFTVPADRQAEIMQLARETGVPVAHVGTVTSGTKPMILDQDGQAIDIQHAGWKHF